MQRGDSERIAAQVNDSLGTNSDNTMVQHAFGVRRRVVLRFVPAMALAALIAGPTGAVLARPLGIGDTALPLLIGGLAGLTLAVLGSVPHVLGFAADGSVTLGRRRFRRIQYERTVEPGRRAVLEAASPWWRTRVLHLDREIWHLGAWHDEQLLEQLIETRSMHRQHEATV